VAAAVVATGRTAATARARRSIESKPKPKPTRTRIERSSSLHIHSSIIAISLFSPAIFYLSSLSCENRSVCIHIT